MQLWSFAVICCKVLSIIDCCRQTAVCWCLMITIWNNDKILLDLFFYLGHITVITSHPFFPAWERIRSRIKHPENYNERTTTQAELDEKLQRLAQPDFADHYFQRYLPYCIFPLKAYRPNPSILVPGGNLECEQPLFCCCWFSVK